jgi:ABC-type Zn uptake system ZnuABC Zn-binding protein ZnuA
MYLYSIPETTLIIYGISIVIPLMMQTIKMAESMESEKTTVTSMSPYPDIFSEDFKITDEIKYDVLKKPRTTIHSYDLSVR